MDNREGDPPESDSDASLGDATASPHVADARPGLAGARPPVAEAPPRVADARPLVAEVPLAPVRLPTTPANDLVRSALEAYVSSREKLAQMRRQVARKVPGDDVDDVLNDAVKRALDAKSPPDTVNGIPGWMRTLVRREIARYYRKKKARDEHEALTERIDEVVDPRTEEGWNVDGVLIRPWLEKQVEGDERDEELFDILMEKARSGMTYEALAVKHGMTLPALTSRIFVFKRKYGPRFDRYKRNTFLLLLLGGVAAIALALVLWWLLGARAFQHAQTPPVSPLRPTPSAPAREGDPSKDVGHPPPR
jgi:DNA-directed RNA polymerase specialized sigma24 family protein